MIESYHNPILAEAAKFVEEHFRYKVGQQYVYHDFNHVQNVVEAARLIAKSYNLSGEQLEVLELAAWFHDSGFSEGAKGHEERSVEIASAFLKNQEYDKDKIEQVSAAILDTRYDAKPMDLLNQILRDADLSHLGSLTYWNNCGKVRQELAITQDKIMSEQEWINFELSFMEKQEYITEVARSLFQEQKEKHVKQLKKRKMRLYPEEMELEVEKKKKKKSKKKKKGKKKKKKGKGKHFDSEAELKELKLGRGVETMYRSTYRTHINLSSIADNKANIMLSINAIIISIVVSSLVPKFLDFPVFIAPTSILLLVCLISIVFATLSTRPKVTEGKFTESDIKGKTSNLLFFGNYYNMDLDIFHWGMMEMIKDSDFLYSSMTRDLYFLGKVLAKKYRYLSICYNIFMYGLFVVVIAFIIALVIGE